MTAIPSCAGQCGLVAILLGELARDRGVSIDVIRIGHGLDVVPPVTQPQACTNPAPPPRLVPTHREETTA